MRGDVSEAARGGRLGSIREFFRGDPALKGYWSLDGHTRDESGNGKHGTLYGAVPIGDALNRGYYFDGSNDYISIGNFSQVSSCSLLARWSRHGPGGGGSGVVMTKGSDDSGGWGLRLNSSGTTYAVTDSTFRAAGSGVAIRDYDMNFHAGIFNDDTDTLINFINGKFDSSSAPGALRNGTNSYIGKEASYYFHGDIYEAALFFRALSPAEVSQYHQWALGGRRR